MSRPATDIRTTTKECYEDFREKYPDIKISFKEFKNITRTWNELFMQGTIDTGDMYKMPHGCGHICIVKKKKKRSVVVKGIKHMLLPIDWVKSKEYGKTIYHLNHHTEGYTFKWKWYYKKSHIKYSYSWKFIPARVHIRRLAAILKDPLCKMKDYYKLDF